MSMIKKGFSAFALLLVCFYACAKKEEAPSGETPAVPAKPAFTPGETVLIPAGEFIFGSSDKETTAFPQQKINLPAFRIDKYEVTNAEYLDFCIKAPYASEGNYRLFFTAEKGRYPVVNITWNDALAYCKWAGKRLPTEQEWEKAARGADGRRYPWGAELSPERANYRRNGKTTQPGQPAGTCPLPSSGRGLKPVGSYPRGASPYGVRDMAGNAREWV